MSHKIMVVDDNSATRRMVKNALVRNGHQVLEAPDGRTARELMAREHPRVVLQDLMLPDADGFELVGELRALAGPDVSILAFSGFVSKLDEARASTAGFDDIIPKPISPSRLVPLIEAHLPRAERQVLLNAGLAKRCSALASELAVLTGISEAVLRHRNVDTALDEALATCFDAGGVAVGALYLLDDSGALRARPLGGDPRWPPARLATFFGREDLLRQVIATNKPFHLPADDAPPEIAEELLRVCEASALLVVPLTGTSGPLGALLMVARAREVDPDDWRAFAQGVGTQISQVLTLARAYADREAAEQSAARHAALLEAVVDSAPDYVIQLGLDGVVQFVNRADRPLRPDDIVGTVWFDRIVADQRQHAREAFDAVIHTGEPAGFEIQLVQPDGTTRWFQGRFGAVKQAGAIVGCVLIARDVTDSKQTELQLMLADRMASVGTLAAGVAHEINNPLAAVIANLEMALQDIEGIPSPPPDLGDELRDAASAADRVREIVRDLKIFSRVQQDRRGAVDIQKVLDSTLRMASNEIRHRARLVKHYNRVPCVDANESRLGQVFLNLIVNAVQAIPEGDVASNELRISTKLEDGHVVVLFSDTGCGMTPEVQARLFTPFFTTKPPGVGTGLGLAISHRIVTSLGGTLTFTSTPGRGTDFRVSLPVAPPDAVPVTYRVPVVGAAPRRGRVLVVDDEESLAQAIRRYLSADHDVDAASNGQDALTRIAAGERYDVILCDLMMPQMTGMEFHEELLRADPDQARRMVFLTGGAFTQSAREFIERVPNQRIEKPFDLKALRTLVNDLVR